jgi:ubiquinone/menaquinone biosynthesis C-methylase UbiE
VNRAGPVAKTVVTRYDRTIYSAIFETYYDHSDFANFGWWEEETKTQKEACENLMERLIALLPERCGRLLDVACGKGATTRALEKRFGPGAVVGVNISARQLRTSRRNAPRAAFVLMDAAALGFADASFDAVVCVEAAFHFSTREDFLREALRVLKPGGILVLSDILMNLEAERRRDLRSASNYVESPAVYRERLLALGFTDAQVIDATEPCWRRYYWHGVRHFHDRYLKREIDLLSLKTFLEAGYRRVYDIESYILAAARRPMAAS